MTERLLQCGWIWVSAPCEKCGGTGEVRIGRGRIGYGTATRECEACSGSGEMETKVALTDLLAALGQYCARNIGRE